MFGGFCFGQSQFYGYPKYHTKSIIHSDALRKRPTVCVTCVWAGVDSAWEQEKLEARKMLENAAESHTSGARFVRLILIYIFPIASIFQRLLRHHAFLLLVYYSFSSFV